MTREQLIQKWLDHELTISEEQAFTQLEDYAELTKLSRAMKHISTPDFDVDQELESLQKAMKPHTSLKTNWKKILIPIAAILVLYFGIFKFSNNQIKTVETIAAQIEKVTLPDTSTVQLNANSSISYSENNWNDNRNISLNGEAHFKVAKGKKFVVQTTQGKVTVLGTQFNINDRNSFFEVVCFEGSVQVNFKNTIHVLKPGEIFSSENGLSLDSSLINKTPSWIKGKSTFKSKQYKYVLAEFERQYDIKIKVGDIDTNQIFTGSFPHNNLEKALKAITLPLRIDATIIDTKNIQLSSE